VVTENINVNASAEVMDYLRQSGLVYKTAMVDVMEAASCMEKTHYKVGGGGRGVYVCMNGRVVCVYAYYICIYLICVCVYI
jgi:hypothetical protein